MGQALLVERFGRAHVVTQGGDVFIYVAEIGVGVHFLEQAPAAESLILFHTKTSRSIFPHYTPPYRS